MTPSARNRLIAVLALVAAGGALAFISFGDLGENLVYYWSPSEMLGRGDQAYKATIRLGGVVQPGSLRWDEKHTRLEFRVADDHKPGSPAVEVLATETPPQMFREGIGVVVEGTFNKSQLFTSKRLMVNHSNEYRPPAPGEKPKLDTLTDQKTAGK
jgi:cytochrome c-type biogenesis protein CcmE